MTIIGFRRSSAIHFTYLHTDVCLLNLAIPLHGSHRNNLTTIFSTKPEQTSLLKATAPIVLCLFGGLRYVLPLNRTNVISYIISQTFQECSLFRFPLRQLHCFTFVARYRCALNNDNSCVCVKNN